MKRNKSLKNAIFLALMSLITMGGNAQDISVDVTKVKCIYDTQYKGQKLVIRYQQDTVNINSGVEYWLHDLIKLPDSVKFIIIGKLLQFENDTTLCCMNVVSRSFNGIEGCGGKPKGVDRYTIQIDALFMINRLCWPQWMELYSCTPVLYDKKRKRSINNDSDKIKIVFAEYKTWYKERSLKKTIGHYFPFNRGRYGWYNGRIDSAFKQK
jgi:glutathionyl-hydroquinone reductase